MSRSRAVAALAAAILAIAAGAAAPVLAAASGKAGAKPAKIVPPPHLVFHVETGAGEVRDSVDASLPINPASVVKAATSLWALEKLGPEHRFETRIGFRGTQDAARGVLHGDLVVLGGGDPDFHFENANLVARALAGLGIREIRGSVLVDDRFWIGWEGGSEGREHDPARRARTMASRFARALDPARWTAPERQAIRELERRHGFPAGSAPTLAVRGKPGRLESGAAETTTLLVHRSNRLIPMLQRFNAYSNNDIDRFEASLGSAGELSLWLATRWTVNRAEVDFATLSGLGSNRLSPRLLVRLVRDLRDSALARDVVLGDLLPRGGCGPSTLKLYPSLVRGSAARSVVAKTGTLVRQDGGTSVISGIASTASGELLFCVAAPASGSQIWNARKAQEQWIVDLIAKFGGPAPLACGAKPVLSDSAAEVVRDPAATAALTPVRIP